jgi:restriction endonuclease Mrr
MSNDCALTASAVRVSGVISSAEIASLVDEPRRFTLKWVLETAKEGIQDRRDEHERRRWMERQRALDFIRAAEHDVLELVIADYYRALGFGATRIDDGGIVDLELSDKTASVLVCFNLWRSLQVNEATVVQFNQARVGAGAVRGIMITGSGFTWGAEDYARRNSIELVDGEGLLKMVARAPKKQQLRLRQRRLTDSSAA